MQPLGRYLPQQFTHMQPVANSEEDLDSVRSLETVPSPEHADTYEPDENLVIARLASLYPAIALQDLSQVKAMLPTCWNDEDKAKCLTISGDGLRVVHRSADNPTKVPQNATANASAVRANNFIPTVCGIYYFEIVIKESPSGCLGIGVCQKNVQTNRLPGWDTCSYGYHGDDGHFFSSSGNGQPYGEKFSTGDTIGCGINMIENSIFFTKNGALQGIAKENVDFGAELYPVVGMQSPHEKIDANFGQVPFVYDIHEQIEKTKNFVRKQIEAIELPVLEKHDWCHKAVSSYLQVEGYASTFESFNRYIPEPAQEPLDMIQVRKKIMDLIRSHKSAEAIQLIEKYFPQMTRNIISKRKQAMLVLRVQSFVEGVCRFIVNESAPKPSKMANGTSHSSLTNGNSQQPSTSSAPPTQNPHKRSRSNQNDAPSKKVQSARLSVASRLSSSSNDHPCSSKNGTHITNGNGVAFHDVREADQVTNGDISHSESQNIGDYPPEDRATLEELVSLGCCIAEEARTANYMDDYLVQLVEEALPSLYLSKETIRNHPYLHKNHVNTVVRRVNDSIMESFHSDTGIRTVSGPFTLPYLLLMWKERKLRLLEHDCAAAVYTNDTEVIYGSSSDEEEDETDECSSDTSDDGESESDDSMSTYSTTSSEEVSESEGVSDEEEESSSEEEGMDADQPTHSRAAIAAAH